MKNDKLVPGMILVMIGAIFLLHNFGYIHFHWSNIWHLWPIFLVIGGVNLVFAHNTSPWATIIKISVIIAGFALLVFGNFDGRYRWWPHMTYYHNSDNDDNDNSSDDNDDDSDSTMNHGKWVKVSGSNQFNQPYIAGLKLARININGGATTFRLTDSTNQLFSADTKSSHGRYRLNSHTEDSVYVMDFDMKDTKFWNWDDDDNKNSVNIKLNTRPEWEMHIDAGATDLNFDLSKYKMRDVVLNGGAGQFVFKMGEPLETSNVTIKTGASDVTINIPKGAACSIESSSGLSTTDYPSDFIKKDDGHSESANFDAAKTKFYIHISGGVSSFKVDTY